MQCSRRHASSEAVLPSTVLLERGAGEAAPLGGEPHVAACHLDERPGRQARQGLCDARPRDAQPLRDVGVAAEPPLGADDEDRLEVAFGRIMPCRKRTLQAASQPPRGATR